MGQVTIQLGDLPKGREIEQWFVLAPRNAKKDVVSGEVLVRILYSQEMMGLASLGALSGAIGKRSGDSTLSSNSSAAPGSSIMSLTLNTARVIGEEEYSAMDDMRSGEIDLIMPALFAHSASLPCLQIGLPSFAKWATTASVTERIAILDTYRGSIFDLLVGSANEFKTDSVAVFYSLLAFSPLLRLAEAKPYFTSTIASLLAGSLQEPPKGLLGDDRLRHCSNCVIGLANACTSPMTTATGKEKDMIVDAQRKCVEIVVSSGALGVAISLLTPSPSPLNKLILTLVIKTLGSGGGANNNNNNNSSLAAARRIIHDNGFVSIVSKLLSVESDPVTLWIALDALSHYSSSDKIAPTGKNSSSPLTYLDEVYENASIFSSIARVAALDIEGAHGASIAAGVIYLLYALSPRISKPVEKQNGHIFPNLEESTIKLLHSSACASYAKFIPRNEQKPLIAERALALMQVFGVKEGAELQKKFSEAFPETLLFFFVSFAHFDSFLPSFKAHIDHLISWGSLSKDSIIDHIQRTRESDHVDEANRKVLANLLSLL